MSYWLYQSLPGSKNAKIAALVAIVLAVSALLFFVIANIPHYYMVYHGGCQPEYRIKKHRLCDSRLGILMERRADDADR